MTQTFAKIKGLFVNTAKANCSIHESGLMCYNALIQTNKYDIEYTEVDQNNRQISVGYDFFIFNFHYVTMGWLDTSFLKALPGPKFTIVLEVSPNNPFVSCSSTDFDGYLVLDPTLQSIYPHVYAFPRPLENVTELPHYLEKSVPAIGTFGFATEGKGFDKVIDAVNKEFDEALIKINIPKGDYVAVGKLEKIISDLKTHPTKEKIKVEITTDFLDKKELIHWCAANTLNVFLYNRNIAGLSATTDQAIVSERPLAISTDDSFRHIHTYLTPYPFQSLKEAIKNSQPIVRKIKEAWDPRKFAEQFEKVLVDFKVYHIGKGIGAMSLQDIKPVVEEQPIVYKPARKFTRSDFFPPILIRLIRKVLKKGNQFLNKRKQFLLSLKSHLKHTVH